MSTRLCDRIRSEPPLANSLSTWMKEVKTQEEKLVKDEDDSDSDGMRDSGGESVMILVMRDSDSKKRSESVETAGDGEQ